MIKIRKALPIEIEKCLEIRHKVFIEGQNVPAEEEIDGKDYDCDHYLLFENRFHVGTARVRFLEDFAKIERVAILEECKGRGYGKALMLKIISDVEENKGINLFKLSAQIQALDFYAKLGFTATSDTVYMDAGIPHMDMKYAKT